ncbi:MAG TPA: M64 family metallopeptidase [Actinomycetes bacterium]|nr:M64 family metallopeptidase [Actinomycetes bacterium]
MGIADGTLETPPSKTLVNNGPNDKRWNVIILGDGFTTGEKTKYRDAADAFVNALKTTAPFNEATVWGRINVHRVDAWSTQSGADNPQLCADGSGPFNGPTSALTMFDAEFCSGGDRRRLVVDEGVVLTIAGVVPNVEFSQPVVVVNHREFGGSGGSVAVYSLADGAVEIAIHELGHSAFHLADEYEFLSEQGCTKGEPDHDTYTGPEPEEPNVTKDFNKATLKWRHLLTPGLNLPTTTNPDCTKCLPASSPVAAGAVGAFVGARYFHCGLYRPVFNCKMRVKEQPFCPVCKDAIRTRLAVSVPPPVTPVAPSPPPPASKLCFVAGAVYRDPSHADVEQLRRWRDARLAPGARGRLAMRALAAAYARLGPPLARAVERSPWLCGLLRRRLFEPLADGLRRRGHEGGR